MAEKKDKTEQKALEDAASLMAAPGPPPASWAYIGLGLGGAIALAVTAAVLIYYFQATRPLDLLATTQALGDHIAEILKENLVPAESIKQAAPRLREEAACRWYHHEFDIDVPEDMSAKGLEAILSRGMEERQARVSGDSPLEYSLGPYPFATVKFNGGAVPKDPEGHAPSVETPVPQPPAESKEREELRIMSLQLVTAIIDAIRGIGAPAMSIRVNESTEQEDANAVWSRTRIDLVGWAPPSLEILQSAVNAAVSPLGAPAVEANEGGIVVSHLGHPMVDIVLGPAQSTAPVETPVESPVETPVPAPMPAPGAEKEELRTASLSLALLTREGLVDAGVPRDGIVTAAEKESEDPGAVWTQTQLQVRGGTQLPPADALAAVIKRIAAPSVEAGVDESAGPAEIHVKLHGRLCVVVELSPRAEAPAPKHSEDLPPETSTEGQEEEALVPAPDAPVTEPRVAVILDDGGYGNGATEAILKMDPKLTLAILPYTPFGKETAERGAAAGFEIMLHMPMEPIDAGIKFQGQLNVGMPPEEVARLTLDALATVPGVTGINNHTGSKFTSDAASMANFFAGISGQPYFFIDSATSGKSQAFEEAKTAGFRAGKRSVFLDDKSDAAYIRKQFAILRDKAKKTGSAIGIGHFRPKTVEVLPGELEKFKKEGIKLVHASELTE